MKAYRQITIIWLVCLLWFELAGYRIYDTILYAVISYRSFSFAHALQRVTNVRMINNEHFFSWLIVPTIVFAISFFRYTLGFFFLHSLFSFLFIYFYYCWSWSSWCGAVYCWNQEDIFNLETMQSTQNQTKWFDNWNWKHTSQQNRFLELNVPLY